MILTIKANIANVFCYKSEHLFWMENDEPAVEVINESFHSTYAANAGGSSPLLMMQAHLEKKQVQTHQGRLDLHGSICEGQRCNAGTPSSVCFYDLVCLKHTFRICDVLNQFIIPCLFELGASAVEIHWA